MQKHQTILNFLDRIENLVDSAGLTIIDLWEADLCAIGLKKKDRLIYISTFNYLNSKAPRYDYDLELYDEKTPDTINMIKRATNASEPDLIDAIQGFFGLV